MKTDPAMPLNVGEYLQDTTGLSRAEHGSYMLLIMAYWANGGPLENDDKCLQSTARCPDHEWARTKGLMAKFFDVSNGVWKHKRIDLEIEKSKRRAAISAMGVQARRDRGQIPQPPTEVTQTVQPTVSPSVARIGQEKELDRVEIRLKEIKSQGSQCAGGTTIYTVPQKAEMKALRDRRDQLKQALGYVA